MPRKRDRRRRAAAASTGAARLPARRLRPRANLFGRTLPLADCCGAASKLLRSCYDTCIAVSHPWVKDSEPEQSRSGLQPGGSICYTRSAMDWRILL